MSSTIPKLLLLLLISCHPNLSGKFPYSEEQLLRDSKKILYLTIRTQKDTLSNTLQNEIIQFQITAGKLKSFKEGLQDNGSPGNWCISILDRQNRIICSQFIQNPLDYEREVFGENGQIELKKIQLSSAQIPLRFPWLPQMKKIKIDSLTLSLKPVTFFKKDFPISETIK